MSGRPRDRALLAVALPCISLRSARLNPRTARRPGATAMPLLHRDLPFASVHAALAAVERLGSADPSPVAIEAHRSADGPDRLRRAARRERPMSAPVTEQGAALTVKATIRALHLPTVRRGRVARPAHPSRPPRRGAPGPNSTTARRAASAALTRPVSPGSSTSPAALLVGGGVASTKRVERPPYARPHCCPGSFAPVQEHG